MRRASLAKGRRVGSVFRHPQRHLVSYSGILQADAYGGYGKLYAAGRSPGAILEAACWSHYLEHSFIWNHCCPAIIETDSIG